MENINVFRANQFFHSDMSQFALLHVDNRPEDYPEQETKLNRRDFWKIFYIESGTGTLVINGNAYAFKPGFIGLIHPDDFTTLRLKQPVLLYNILFQEHFIADALSRLTRGNRFFAIFRQRPTELLNHELLHLLDVKRTIFTLIRKMEQEYFGGECNAEEMIRVFLVELLIRMERAQFNKNMEQRNSTLITLVVKYLQTHFGKNIEIGKLAEKFGFSRGYFLVLFKRKTGKTIGQTLQDIRLAHACELLQTTDLSVETISYRSGFSEQGNFYKLFRRKFNMTPGQFKTRRVHKFIESTGQSR